ncbi:MAG: DUF1304 domain-containing protein [Anaerolineales bacterium]|nr:DUF1304 domain-containing protein [Anaerolineales bacterium]
MSRTAPKIFSTTADFAKQSKALAANQGLYNGFLAAGLVWGLIYPDAKIGLQIRLFLSVSSLPLGGFTVKRSILLAQGAPAACLLAVLRLGWPHGTV